MSKKKKEENMIGGIKWKTERNEKLTMEVKEKETKTG